MWRVLLLKFEMIVWKNSTKISNAICEYPEKSSWCCCFVHVYHCFKGSRNKYTANPSKKTFQFYVNFTDHQRSSFFMDFVHYVIPISRLILAQYFNTSLSNSSIIPGVDVSAITCDDPEDREIFQLENIGGKWAIRTCEETFWELKSDGAIHKTGKNR